MKTWLMYGLCGCAAGAVNGLFGTGGGLVLVPLLLHTGKMDSREAFATAISITLPLCLVTLGVYRFHALLSPEAALPYLLGGAVGGIAGGMLFQFVPPRLLHKLFAIFILWGGIRLLWT